MSDIASYQGELSNSQEEKNAIPRLDRIENPLQPYAPQKLPQREEFNSDELKIYSNFIKKVLPAFELDVDNQPSQAISFLKQAVENDSCTSIYCDLLVHAFLLNCSYKQSELIACPSLTKYSVLHHELYQCSEIIHNCNKISFALDDQCEMMQADVSDLYHSHISEIADQKFWGKTRSTADLINILLKKEVQRLRLLNQNTFHHLSLLAMRKAIDSAPVSSVNELISWAQSQGIPYD